VWFIKKTRNEVIFKGESAEVTKVVEEIFIVLVWSLLKVNGRKDSIMAL
jgi:hypothetical protein